MALATVDADGLPNARMVLLKGFDERGFVFYTNLDSVKGHELADAPKAALTFYWKSLQRQVRLRGTVEPVSAAEADAYFATRSRMAQIGAWASKQSRAARKPLGVREGGRALYREIRASGRCRGRRTGRAIASRRRRSSSGRSGRSACMIASPSRAPARPRRGARRGFIHEDEHRADHAEQVAQLRQRDDGNDQPAAPHAPPHRSEPRHRPRHRQALLRRRLARHHLLAASVPGELSVGGRARGPHPGRSGGARKTPRRRSRKPSAGSTASCMRWSTMPRSRQRPRAASGSARSTPRATTGTMFSR